MPTCDLCGNPTPFTKLRRCRCPALDEPDCRLCPTCWRTRRCGTQGDCLLCDGKGVVPRQDIEAISVKCPRCDGSGQVPIAK